MKSLKEQVAERASHCCEYCLSQVFFSSSPFSIEHIIPKAKGGSNDLDNLALACQGCNNSKYTYTSVVDPISGELALIYNPREHIWSDHFQWSKDFMLLIGLSPTGRATIEQLKLNRLGVINQRRILHKDGLHPPS